MNIGEAMGHLKDGRTVTRAAWRTHRAVTDYVHLTLETPPGFGRIVTVQLSDGYKGAYNCSQGDLLADDWEIVK